MASWQGAEGFPRKAMCPVGCPHLTAGPPLHQALCGHGHFSRAGCGRPLVTRRCVQKPSHRPTEQNNSFPRKL